MNKYTPYKIVKKFVRDEDGRPKLLKIGYIGFVPPQINEWDKSHLDGKVITKNIIESAEKFIPQMKKKGADIIIAQAHSGFNGSETNTEDVIYALSKVKGINALTFSHTHKIFPAADEKSLDALFKDAKGNVLPGVDNAKGTINGVPAVQAGYGGGSLGLIDLTLQQDRGRWKVVSSQSSVRSAAAVKPDEKVVNTVKNAHEATIKYVNTPIGSTTDDIHSFFALVQDDPSVQVVTNAQKWYVEKYISDGKAVDPNQDFIVVTNNYRAGGGGNFPGVKGSEYVVDSADENRQILMDYITEMKEITPTADNNWSIAPISGNTNVTFLSSPNGQKYTSETGKIQYTNKTDANGFGIYSIDLK